MTASRAIQDKQLENSLSVTTCYQELQPEIFISNQRSIVPFRISNGEFFSNMATCHQDPEPELDYRLELDVVVIIWFSSGLGVTWGMILLLVLRSNMLPDQQRANWRILVCEPSSYTPSTEAQFFTTLLNHDCLRRKRQIKNRRIVWSIWHQDAAAEFISDKRLYIVTNKRHGKLTGSSRLIRCCGMNRLIIPSNQHKRQK